MTDDVIPVVVTDPHRNFGKPMFAASGACVDAVVDRLFAGESLASVAIDFELTDAEVGYCEERATMTDDIVAILRSERNNCRCNAYYSGECCCDAKWAEDYVVCAADEIERLRARVKELLPFAHGDAKSGASVAHWPGGHDCEPICEDCQWHLDSVALLARIEAGEFGPLNNSW